jgi:hypothetical protein
LVTVGTDPKPLAMIAAPSAERDWIGDSALAAE